MITKRFFITLLSLFLIVSAFAAKKNLEKDITMVSYEQSWLDNNGTLALRNNTNEPVFNVVYTITYLDMSNNELDYETFSSDVNIDPGRTRKVDIPAYEHERHYHYYKTKENLGYPTFKIKFTLKDYNVAKEDKYEESEGYYNYNSNVDVDDDNTTFSFLFYIILLLFAIGASIGFYVLVAVMAQKRNRNVAVWVLLSIIATPLLMIIILLIIGDNQNHVGNHYNKE
jgi:hypothetical protein